jgi:hypothetical protein
MNGKFIVYALIVAFISVIASWGKLLSPGQGGSGSYRSGSSWSSSSNGGSWGGGGHK